MPHEPVRSIVIVGGGTAGWMAATYLARRLAHLNLAITVVDSAAIGTVGVGEATVPAIRDFLSAIELGEADVLRETGGTIKYGIRFDGWGGDGHRFFHPFGLYGVGAQGVASGFLEPLESTSISLIQSGLERFVALFPDRECDPRLAATYNRQSVLEFERLRDFLFLHYLANGRDEPFWQAIRAVEPPEPLQVRLDAWRSGGEFVRNEWDTFQDPSWLSIYAGFGDLPARHSPLADAIGENDLVESFARMRSAIAKTLSRAEPHAAFLARVAGG